MRRVVPILVLAGVIAAMGWTARVHEAGSEWRVAFVLLAVGAVPMVAWSVSRIRPTAGWVVGIALALRLLLLPVSPSLSDDGYRYLWDGARTVSGVSPYADTPREAVGVGFQSPVRLGQLNSPDYHSVYPPVSQSVFAFSMLLSGSFGIGWIVYKLIIVLVEVAGLWALSRHVDATALAWYAWHPVAVVEIAGQGHTEGMALGLLSLAVAAMASNRWAWGGSALALAGWVKLWPFALASLFWNRPRVVLAVTATAVVVGVPWLWGANFHGVVDSLALYGGTFDFYSAPYLAIKAVLWPGLGAEAGPVAAALLGLVGLGAFAVIAIRVQTLTVGLAAAVCALTVFSPTLHPWHLLPVLWAAVLLPWDWRWPALWLVSIAPVTYLGYVGFEAAMGAAMILGWGGGGILWCITQLAPRGLSTVLAWRGEAKWKRIKPLLSAGRPLRILDLGCAEGQVGAAASRDGHEVTLADLHDNPQRGLPYVRVSQQGVPLPSDEMDVVLLVFVLHHAESPEQLLNEAARIGSNAVVWESVPGPWAPKPLLQRLDLYVNRLREGPEMRHAQLRSVPEWEEAFATTGWRILTRETWGQGHPQALWHLKRVQHIPQTA